MWRLGGFSRVLSFNNFGRPPSTCERVYNTNTLITRNHITLLRSHAVMFHLCSVLFHVCSRASPGRRAQHPSFLFHTHVCDFLQAVAHNIRDTTAAYLKPPMMSAEEWARECAVSPMDASCSPPQPLIPVVIDGFDGLRARMDAQDEQGAAFLRAAQVRFSAFESGSVERAGRGLLRAA